LIKAKKNPVLREWVLLGRTHVSDLKPYLCERRFVILNPIVFISMIYSSQEVFGINLGYPTGKEALYGFDR
jgi:hypothetical protein